MTTLPLTVGQEVTLSTGQKAHIRWIGEAEATDRNGAEQLTGTVARATLLVASARPVTIHFNPTTGHCLTDAAILQVPVGDVA